MVSSRLTAGSSIAACAMSLSRTPTARVDFRFRSAVAAVGSSGIVAVTTREPKSGPRQLGLHAAATTACHSKSSLGRKLAGDHFGLPTSLTQANPPTPLGEELMPEVIVIEAGRYERNYWHDLWLS
jgi:hypothetical protein